MKNKSTKTSVFIRLYGKTLHQLASSLNISISKVYLLHKEGKLKKSNNILPEKLDKRIVCAFNAARGRCQVPTLKNKKYYINRKIQFKLSYEDIYFLWKRDKAFKMNNPSLDRKDSNKDYIKSNCRFIEWNKHLSMPRRTTPYFVYSRDKNGKRIK